MLREDVWRLILILLNSGMGTWLDLIRRELALSLSMKRGTIDTFWTRHQFGNQTQQYHHHHQVPDLEQTLATMPLQTSLSSDNFKKFKPLLCPPVAELQRLSRNVIRCLPLSRLPSTLPVKDKNSKPLRLHTCPKTSICLFLIVFNSDLWTFPSLNTFTLVFFSGHEILNIRLINHISAASIFFSMSLVIVQHPTV